MIQTRFVNLYTHSLPQPLRYKIMTEIIDSFQADKFINLLKRTIIGNLGQVKLVIDMITATLEFPMPQCRFILCKIKIQTIHKNTKQIDIISIISFYPMGHPFYQVCSVFNHCSRSFYCHCFHLPCMLGPVEIFTG